MEKKSLYDISWKVSEEIYRKDPSLSYSTLARFEREGFNNLDKLFDKIESPSLLFGSCVDTILTDGIEAFEKQYVVVQYPDIPDSIITIVKSLYKNLKDNYKEITDIPNNIIIDCAGFYNYQNNWKPETRAKVIKEKGAIYYKLLFKTEGKIILSENMYQDVMNSVRALKESDATKFYFAPNNPFDNIERLYQLKFKGSNKGVNYRIMADLIVVDYNNKTIQPVDLKTSSKPEWDFYKSFIDWRYDVQAKLYWRIIKQNIEADSYFKNFKLLDYKFIVVNKRTLTPLVWDFPLTESMVDLYVGANHDIKLRDPYKIGEELNYYLKSTPKVPEGINMYAGNDIIKWLNKL